MSRSKSSSSRATRKDSSLSPKSSGSLDALALAACALLWIGTIATTNDSANMPGLFDWMGTLWALLATAILVLTGWKRIDIARQWSSVDTVLAIWIGWQCASVAFVFGQGNVRLAMNGLLQSVTMGVIYWCIRGTASRPIDQKWFLAIALSAVAGIGAAGIYQRHVLQPRVIAEYQRDPEAYLGPLAIEYPAGSPQRAHLEDRLKSTEPTATFALTNSFAGLLATWLMVLIATRKKSPSAAELDREQDWLRVIYRNTVPESLGVVSLFLFLAPIAIGLLIGYTLLLTKSRTALLALIAGLGLWGFSQFGKWGLRTAVTLVSIVAASAAIGLVLLGLGVWDIEVFSESPKSVLYRLEYWYSSLRMIAEHPWSGVGPGNFQSAYAQYKLPQASETVADPHNFVLEVFATTGIPGGIGAMAALIFAIAKCLPAAKPASQNQGQSPFAADDRSFDLWGSLLTLALGFLLAEGVSLLSQWTGGGNLEALLFVGLPAACVAFVILSPRIARASDLKAPTVAGVVVLLINLLGAGGWSFPSVASSLWLLLAIGANGNLADQRKSSEVPTPQALLPPATAAALIFAGVWAVAVTRLELVPVAGSQVQVALAQDLMQARDLAKAEHAASEAEKLDVWSDVPPATSAQVHWQQYLRERLPADLDRFETALLRRQSRSPRSASLRAQNGDLFAAAYRETGDPRWLAQATSAYREAHLRYPASGVLAVQLALAEWMNGNRSVATKLAEKALELDRQNPHIEQKLKSQKIAWLVPNSMKDPPPELAKLLENRQNSAEHVALYLRSTAAANEP